MSEDTKSLSLPEDFNSKLLEASDPDELKDLVDLFNFNLKKKELLRLNSFSDMQDSVVEELSQRLLQNSGSFSNTDLLNYLNSIQKILDKSNQEEKYIPTIAIQKNNTINIDGTTLSRESKDRVKAAIKAILDGNNDISDLVEIEDGKEGL